MFGRFNGARLALWSLAALAAVVLTTSVAGGPSTVVGTLTGSDGSFPQVGPIDPPHAPPGQPEAAPGGTGSAVPGTGPQPTGPGPDGQPGAPEDVPVGGGGPSPTGTRPEDPLHPSFPPLSDVDLVNFQRVDGTSTLAGAFAGAVSGCTGEDPGRLPACLNRAAWIFDNIEVSVVAGAGDGCSGGWAKRDGRDVLQFTGAGCAQKDIEQSKKNLLETLNEAIASDELQSLGAASLVSLPSSRGEDPGPGPDAQAGAGADPSCPGDPSCPPSGPAVCVPTPDKPCPTASSTEQTTDPATESSPPGSHPSEEPVSTPSDEGLSGDPDGGPSGDSDEGPSGGGSAAEEGGADQEGDSGDGADGGGESDADGASDTGGDAG